MAVGAALMTAFVAVPDGAKADALYGPCMKAASTSVAMADCGGSLVQREEGRLAAAWRKAFAAVGGSKSAAGADLLAEQRAWIAYKDKACRYWASGDFGSLGRVTEAPQCRANVIADRVKILKVITDRQN